MKKLMCVVGKDGIGCWRKQETLEIIDGPKYKDIVTFDGVASETCIFLKEWPDEEGWEARCFVPIDEDLNDEIMRAVNREKVEILT